MNPSIEVQGLSKAFGDFKAVDDVTFEAQGGKITAVLGPSGSGKSTVLRILAGLEAPDSGHVYVDGEELTNRNVQDRRLGFVFQHFALFRHMTVAENIAFGLSVRRESKDTQSERVAELLHLVQLEGYGSRYPDQLSGGQRQRVALARALAPNPKVLLLDEPFGALDARVRRDLRAWLDRLHNELHITSLLVTHDQEEALELANEVVVMHQGRVEQMGTPTEVYNNPATPFVAGFVGAANVLEGIVINGRVQFGEQFVGGAGHLQDGAAAHAYVRPHDVQLVKSADAGSASPATIDRITDLGWTSKIQLSLPDGQSVVAEVPNERLNGAHEGQSTCIDLRNAKVFELAQEAPSDELAGV
ncbi:MAG: sulfate/molybdate ABC transporter ATP-binding protein [Actinomycetota bacterium]|nr:sulfate/molybdate ABC transporter ATP-binding protein [Actinomycetota bacterium]